MRETGAAWARDALTLRFDQEFPPAFTTNKTTNPAPRTVAGWNPCELGGHSLVAVRLIERMRRRGLFVDVQALLTAPTLAEMAVAVSDGPIEVAVPENLITDDTTGRARGRADDFELLS